MSKPKSLGALSAAIGVETLNHTNAVGSPNLTIAAQHKPQRKAVFIDLVQGMANCVSRIKTRPGSPVHPLRTCRKAEGDSYLSGSATFQLNLWDHAIHSTPIWCP